MALKHRPIIDTYPKLIKGKLYIFASAHFWSEDIAAGVSCIDKNAYALIGSTNSVEVNPMFYAAWLNGVIYVDRLNAKSRSDALQKMERILQSGSSVLIYPEGGWNNTENLLCSPFPEEVRRTLKNVKVTKYNAHIILPILEQIKEDEKYNFNRIMHENWNK